LLVMAPSSQELEPPANPGRFKALCSNRTIPWPSPTRQQLALKRPPVVWSPALRGDTHVKACGVFRRGHGAGEEAVRAVYTRWGKNAGALPVEQGLDLLTCTPNRCCRGYDLGTHALAGLVSRRQLVDRKLIEPSDGPEWAGDEVPNGSTATVVRDSSRSPSSTSPSTRTMPSLATSTGHRGGAQPAEIEGHPNALGHAIQPTLWSKDAQRQPMPIAGDAERTLQDARRPVAGCAEGQ
jgi:hypothetical protein